MDVPLLVGFASKRDAKTIVVEPERAFGSMVKLAAEKVATRSAMIALSRRVQ